MSERRIGLTDDQRAMLDERLRELLVARERFNEMVRLLGGEGARYNQQEGVIVTSRQQDVEGGEHQRA